MMDKCRICLGMKKTLMSIFEGKERTTYAFMISNIANVKLHQNDGITDKICRSCRKSLTEAYNFKMLIEQSDAALNDYKGVKKIKFENIKDIKIDLEIDNKQCIPKIEDNMTEYFRDGAKVISYSNTTIKKIDTSNNEDVGNKPVPVLDFLKAIGEEDDNFVDNLDYGPDIDNDCDYIPPYTLLEKEKGIKKTRSYVKQNEIEEDEDIPGKKRKVEKNISTRKNRKPTNIRKVCIKPVIIKDLVPVYYEKLPKEQRKPVKKYVYTKMCPHCGIMTTHLKSHILKHIGERKFKCDKCGRGFVSRSALNSHMKRHNPKTLKCDQCIATFATEDCLRSHKRTHTTEKEFVCGTCSKGFKRKCALKRHEMLHNVANKNVLCDFCNMSFFSKYGLRHHLRIHTGERPFKCEICNQPYSYKHDFNRHCLKKHGVFLKRRSVYIMNEEVLQKERALMRDLLLRINGVIKDDKPLNPFEGPQGWQAFEQAVKALQNQQIPIDLNL